MHHPPTLPLRCLGKETKQLRPDQTRRGQKKKNISHLFFSKSTSIFVYTQTFFNPIPSSFHLFPSPWFYLCSLSLQIFAFLGESNVSVLKSCVSCWVFQHSDRRCMSHWLPCDSPLSRSSSHLPTSAEPSLLVSQSSEISLKVTFQISFALSDMGRIILNKLQTGRVQVRTKNVTLYKIWLYRGGKEADCGLLGLVLTASQAKDTFDKETRCIPGAGVFFPCAKNSFPAGRKCHAHGTIFEN